MHTLLRCSWLYSDNEVISSQELLIVLVHPAQAYVFVVGGGNYIEYQNLQDYCRRQQSVKKVTYGTSQLMNAAEFLQQVRTTLVARSVACVCSSDVLQNLLVAFLLFQLADLGAGSGE